MSTKLSPEEIRKLPMRRDLPYNGLTREQVVAIGLDPDEVEAGRVSANEFAQEQAQRDAEQIAHLAAQVVAAGEMLPAEVATLLHANNPQAHALFVAAWRGQEAEERIQGLAEEIEYDDAETYTARMQLLELEERERLEEEQQAALDDLGRKQLLGVRDTLQDYLATTPGAHADAERLGKRVFDKVIETNYVPDEAADKQRLVAEAAHEIAVADNARESLSQQVDAEWRILRKERGATDGLTSAADIARAEKAYKEGRFAQLAESTKLPANALDLPPSSAELQAREVEKRQAQNDREQSFHDEVHAIRERGAKPGERDRGEHMTEDRNAYREAMKRAEETAAYGEYAAVRSGYGDGAVTAEKSTGHGPTGDWPDELGPAI